MEVEKQDKKGGRLFEEKKDEGPKLGGFMDIENSIQCQLCQKSFLDFDTEKFWYLVSCYHCICRGCLIKHILTNFIKENGQVKCPLPLCTAYILDEDIMVLLIFCLLKPLFENWKWVKADDRKGKAGKAEPGAP